MGGSLVGYGAHIPQNTFSKLCRSEAVTGSASAMSNTICGLSSQIVSLILFVLLTVAGIFFLQFCFLQTLSFRMMKSIHF